MDRELSLPGDGHVLLTGSGGLIGAVPRIVVGSSGSVYGSVPDQALPIREEESEERTPLGG